MIRQLLLSLRQLLFHWWRTDRIRVAASTGSVLDLQRGDTVAIDGVRYEIKERLIHQDRVGPVVDYRCCDCLEGVPEPARLIVGPVSQDRLYRIVLSSATVSMELSEDQLTCYRNTKTRPGHRP